MHTLVTRLTNKANGRRNTLARRLDELSEQESDPVKAVRAELRNEYIVCDTLMEMSSGGTIPGPSRRARGAGATAETLRAVHNAAPMHRSRRPGR